MAPLNERQTIEEFVTLDLREFAAVWSLSGPDFYRRNHATRIVYPYRNDLAIEVELDWWEFKAFTLIVRLEEGKLPEGYIDRTVESLGQPHTSRRGRPNYRQHHFGRNRENQMLVFP